MLRKTIITIAISAAISGALALAPVDAFARGGGGGGGGHGGGGGGHGGGGGGHGGGGGPEGAGSPVVMLAGSAAAGSVVAGLVVPVSAVVQSVASAAGLAVSAQLR